VKFTLKLPSRVRQENAVKKDTERSCLRASDESFIATSPRSNYQEEKRHRPWQRSATAARAPPHRPAPSSPGLPQRQRGRQLVSPRPGSNGSVGAGACAGARRGRCCVSSPFSGVFPGRIGGRSRELAHQPQARGTGPTSPVAHHPRRPPMPRDACAPRGHHPGHPGRTTDGVSSRGPQPQVPPTLSRARPTSPRVVPLGLSAVPVLPVATRFARDKAQEPFNKQRGSEVRCGAVRDEHGLASKQCAVRHTIPCKLRQVHVAMLR